MWLEASYHKVLFLHSYVTLGMLNFVYAIRFGCIQSLTSQCDQIGLILKDLGTKFLANETKICADFFLRTWFKIVCRSSPSRNGQEETLGGYSGLHPSSSSTVWPDSVLGIFAPSDPRFALPGHVGLSETAPAKSVAQPRQVGLKPLLFNVLQKRYVWVIRTKIIALLITPNPRKRT